MGARIVGEPLEFRRNWSKTGPLDNFPEGPSPNELQGLRDWCSLYKRLQIDSQRIDRPSQEG